jgi:uncharacterized membrane-anchored protein YitT (DUF2179 family)
MKNLRDTGGKTASGKKRGDPVGQPARRRRSQPLSHSPSNDRRLFLHSFHGMLLCSFFIDLFSPFRAWNLFSTPTSAVLGGVWIGAGIGLMLAYETNTGGSDLLAQFVARRYNLPVALLIFLIDGMIVAASFEAIGLVRTAFSLVTITAVGIATHVMSRIRRSEPPRIVVGPIRR